MRFTEIGSPNVTQVQSQKADDGRANALHAKKADGDFAAMDHGKFAKTHSDKAQQALKNGQPEKADAHQAVSDAHARAAVGTHSVDDVRRIQSFQQAK